MVDLRKRGLTGGSNEDHNAEPLVCQYNSPNLDNGGETEKDCDYKRRGSGGFVECVVGVRIIMS